MNDEMTVERSTVTGNGQCVRLHEIGAIGGFHIELDIKTDSYKNQGHAIARVWSAADLKWNVVSMIDPLAMQTDAKLGYKPSPASVKDFDSDRKTLLKEVAFVLSVSQERV